MATFEGVEDTLFIPLVGRVYSSKHFKDFFYDEKALELEQYIPSDSIKKKSNEYFMIASLARYKTFDTLVHNFLSQHRHSNVICLGCGLETMYFRINPKNAKFYEIDLPSVIAQRKLVLGENDHEILIGSDILDFTWMNKVDAHEPTMIIVAGVFQYLHREEIIKLIDEIKCHFDNVEIAFDATNKMGLKGANKYVKKTGNDNARMYFYVQDATKFAVLSKTTLLGEYPFYSESRVVLKDRLKLMTKISCYFGDKLGFTKIIHLKIK